MSKTNSNPTLTRGLKALEEYDMIRATGASRNTLKEHFKRLLEQGHLVRHGTGKATWYALP